MRIQEVSWRRYSLPFVSPFLTAHGETTHRHGLILKLADDDGLVGFGEAAPLTEFGGGDIDQTERRLRWIAPQLSGLSLDELERLLGTDLPQRPDAAALRCALDTALLDLEARRQGIRLAELLTPNAASAVSVNATIGQADTQRALDAAQQAVSEGLGTIKLKVGIGRSDAEELERIAAVRDAIGPDVSLRLDANGAWNPAQAVRILHEVVAFNIEFVEQPTGADDLAGLFLIRRAVDIPIAADESVTSLDAARRVVEAGAADVLVIKPMVCGGLRVARSIIEQTTEAGLRSVVTSSLESGIGVAATLHLAATLPPGSPACGLATLHLLADDLVVERLDVVNGEMCLPDGPGLGVTMDEEAMTRYARRS